MMLPEDLDQNEEDKCLESLLKPTKCVCGEPSDTNVVHRSDAPCYYKSQPAQQDPRDDALEDAKQFEAVVVASDHPDVMGGIVWSDCELRWINEKLHTAKAAGMREAAKICYDIDREYEGEDVSAIWCMNDILKAAERVEGLQKMDTPKQLRKIHPLDFPIEVFLADLTTRPANIIRAELEALSSYAGTGTFDIEPPFTVRHLCMFSRSEMRKWPNFGRKCLNEVEEMLRARGLQLWENHDERSLRLLREHKEYFA